MWKNSAIFGVEDDTQNGADHVDGHRGPAFVISPYAKGGVEDEYETQLNMVRTVEQILGIQPMNQEDYAAEPIYRAFTETPNFEAYTAIPNEIPLTLGVEGEPATAAAKSGGPVQGEVPASMQSVYNAWMSWKRQQPFLGREAGPTRPSRCCSTVLTGTPRTTGRWRTRATRRSTCLRKCLVATYPPRSSATETAD